MKALGRRSLFALPLALPVAAVAASLPEAAKAERLGELAHYAIGSEGPEVFVPDFPKADLFERELHRLWGGRPVFDAAPSQADPPAGKG